MLLSVPNVPATTLGVEIDAPLVLTTATLTELPMETATDADALMDGLLFLTVWPVTLLLPVLSVTTVDPSSKMETATPASVTRLIDGEATNARLVCGTAMETEPPILLAQDVSVTLDTLLPLTAVSVILLTLLLSVTDMEPSFKMVCVTDVPVMISGVPTLAGTARLFVLMEAPYPLELARDATALTDGTQPPTARLVFWTGSA